MGRGRSRWTLAALLGAFALTLGLSACGGSQRARSTTVGTTHTRTHRASSTTATVTGASTTATSSTAPGSGGTTTSTTSAGARSGGGSGSGSGGSSGGAPLSGATTTTHSTTTSTSSACTGQDCQNGSPTVPGSVAPVNGRCREGYVYVAAQDGGPALCIPVSTTTTSSTATQ